VVIGNPPYVFTRGEGFTDVEKEYFYTKFKQQHYQLNTYTMFIEQGYNLLKTSGTFGFIIPNNWLTISSMKKFRDFIISSTRNVIIVNNLHKVFSGANVDTSILTFKKDKPNNIRLMESPMPDICNKVSKINYKDLLEKPIIQIRKQNESLHIIDKIEEHSCMLGNIVTVSTGLKAYQIGKGIPSQTKKIKENRVFHSMKKINKSYGKYLQGVDVKRYAITWSGEYLSYGDWLAEPRRSVPFNGPRILVRQIPSILPYMINAAYEEDKYYNDINSMVIFSDDGKWLKFILGIINSKVISFWFNKEFDKMQRNIFPQFKVNELKTFPIPILDLSKKSDKAKHDKLILLVDKMLELKKREATETNTDKKSLIAKQISGIDGAIDSAVYELYGLSEEEVRVVEGEIKLQMGEREK
jgi:type I restriction-modification system DNA methylase subunit